MSNHMLGNPAALGDFCRGPLADLMTKLAGKDGEQYRAELNKLLRREPGWWPAQSDRLTHLSTHQIPATTTTFVCEKDFARHLDGKFWSWFGDKRERPKPETVLLQCDLTKASLDTEIIADLGGEAEVETTLVEIKHLMGRQKDGEAGVLLNNGWWNIFYVRDRDGVLRSVHVGWYGGWCADARPLDRLHGWHSNNQVFARN